ncbi:MarR family winged helix-turn-helix transcriptional regulator [Lacimonas salitolerans]|uniref:MarR family winged helix-turn-helix transcriptional regulator n=1 Tax=Lacimonas salitolerans TaxID=1323750 RepID=A0ABW4EJR2_9RHOB
MKAQDTTTAPRLDETGLEQFAPYLMNRIMGRYNASLRTEMAALGLTTPQMRSLAVLSVHDGILIRELAVYAVVEQSTLSRALDKLAQDGLVRRETDADDSRATRIFLTDAGRAAYARMWPHMADAVGQMFAGIDAADQRAFVATLQKILRNVRVHDF